MIRIMCVIADQYDISGKGMNSYCYVAPILLELLLSPAVFCMGHTMGSNPGCSGARLYEEYVRSKIIDDCDLLNNTLDIDLSKLSSKPGCIDKMRFHFQSETASRDMETTHYGASSVVNWKLRNCQK